MEKSKTALLESSVLAIGAGVAALLLLLLLLLFPKPYFTSLFWGGRLRALRLRRRCGGKIDGGGRRGGGELRNGLNALPVPNGVRHASGEIGDLRALFRDLGILCSNDRFLRSDYGVPVGKLALQILDLRLQDVTYRVIRGL